MTTATATPTTTTATFTLYGLTGGGCHHWIDYTPQGTVVHVRCRHGERGEWPSWQGDLPVERARQQYAEHLAHGYRRVA